MQPAREASSDKIAAFERAAGALGRVRHALRGVVFGQDAAVEAVLCAVLADGHALVAGAPGVAKTRLAEALSQTLGLPLGRLQFHPDQSPEALVGRTVALDRIAGPQGRFEPGPIFHPLLLADEIERGGAAVQAALFEAMDDSVAVCAGERRPLPRPFSVLATVTDVNAAGSAGLSPSQTDRFLVRVDMTYMERDDERRVLLESGRSRGAPQTPLLDPARLCEAQRLTVELPVGQRLVEAILDLVRRARPEDPAAPAYVFEVVERGPGPRAGQALMRLCRARALIDGRPTPSLADLQALAPMALKHRLVISRKGLDRGWTSEGVVRRLLETVG